MELLLVSEKYRQVGLSIMQSFIGLKFSNVDVLKKYSISF